MTKEQEEAIDYVQKQIDYFKEQIKFIEAVDSDYYEEEYELYKNRTKQFSTVLNLIQEQQEENKKKDKIINEQLKENVKLQAELNTENNRCMILANNDKFKEQIIDLMVEWISERCFYKDDYSNSCEIIQDSCSKEDDCKDCIKQYFERKVKE